MTIAEDWTRKSDDEKTTHTAIWHMLETTSPWGKKSLDGQYHALNAHSMDVAAVFERLLSQHVLHARLKEAAGRAISPTDVARLAALVFLHDIGKLHHGFQAKARADLAPWPGGSVSHSSAGAGFVLQAYQNIGHPFADIVNAMNRWGAVTDTLIMAIFAHHGRPVAPSMTHKNDWRVFDGYDWHNGATGMAEMIQSAFPAAFTSAQNLPEAPAFIHLVAGLTALADWIGSDVRFFPFNANPDETYPATAREAAAAALEAIGLDVSDLLPKTDFTAASGFATPNVAQLSIGQTNTDSKLVILEAETGSGKTEAALWRFAQLFATGQISGLYFAVPTRAAARQLHGRVNAALKRLFGPTAPEAVLAIPGMRVAGEARGQMLPGFETRWDDATGPVPARWAAEHATRFLAATVAVGTVDQAMLAGLQVKHAHLRGAAMARSLLVLDEVHASDTYMTEVVLALLQGHLAIGGHAMLMSATLGSRARARYLGMDQPDFAAAVAAPYPMVWAVPLPPVPVAEPAVWSKSVSMDLRQTMDATPLALEAIEAAANGARVLVIRNTVSAAIATFQAVVDAGKADLLMQLNGGPALHHSRFAAEDRQLLDRAVEVVLSTSKVRPQKGCIVIGSQTLEQSLDIDADFLITDLCPVDVLLQRIGRLHRHILPRPAGFDVPRTVVLCLEGGLDRLAKPAFENGLGGWNTPTGFNGIYTDLAAVELTRRQILLHPVWHIPAMNRALVEAATHPDPQAALIAEKGGAWETYDRTLAGKMAAERVMGQMGVLQRHKPFPERFKSDDEKVMTRLGAQGPVLELPPGTIGPFGQIVCSITLPAHWVFGPVADVALVPEPNADGFEFVVGESRFQYSRHGIDRLSRGKV